MISKYSALGICSRLSFANHLSNTANSFSVLFAYPLLHSNINFKGFTLAAMCKFTSRSVDFLLLFSMLRLLLL